MRPHQINIELHKGRRSTQWDRLTAGAIQAANGNGYAGASVAEVTGVAGVSRPTFYEYFRDKDDCLLAAAEESHERLLADVRKSIQLESPERAIYAAVQALIGFAKSDPATARFLIAETMAGGQCALDSRDRGIAALADLVDEAQAQLPAQTATADFSSRMLLGGTYRLLAARLRRTEPCLAELSGLGRWISSYERPICEHRWRRLEPVAVPGSPPSIADFPLRPPMSLAPGRQRMSEQEVANNHRERILLATALLADSKGYAATTIADITELAGLNARAFYAAFAGKQEAFMTVHELGCQYVMTVIAGAFFGADRWPERSWQAGRAFARLLEQYPRIARVGFVEAYAVEPAVVQRIEDRRAPFTIFLQEGFRHRPQSDPCSRIVQEAIVATIFELVYHQCRASETPQIAGLVPHITFLWLAPFVGPVDAHRFVERQVKPACSQQRQLTAS